MMPSPNKIEKQVLLASEEDKDNFVFTVLYRLCKKPRTLESMSFMEESLSQHLPQIYELLEKELLDD